MIRSELPQRLNVIRDLLTGNYGAHITVLVPKNSSYVLRLSTMNGNVNVAPLHGSSVIIDSKNGDVSINGGSYDTIQHGDLQR